MANGSPPMASSPVRPRVLSDAVAIVLSNAAGNALETEAAAVDGVHDPYDHLKAIACDDGGRELLHAGAVAKDRGVFKAAEAGAFSRPRRPANGTVNLDYGLSRDCLPAWILNVYERNNAARAFPASEYDRSANPLPPKDKEVFKDVRFDNAHAVNAAEQIRMDPLGQ